MANEKMEKNKKVVKTKIKQNVVENEINKNVKRHGSNRKHAHAHKHARACLAAFASEERRERAAGGAGRQAREPVTLTQNRVLFNHQCFPFLSMKRNENLFCIK